jgi:hypothetical protein
MCKVKTTTPFFDNVAILKANKHVDELNVTAFLYLVGELYKKLEYKNALTIIVHGTFTSPSPMDTVIIKPESDV